MKKNTKETTLVEFLFRTEHIPIIESISKQLNLELKWGDVDPTNPFHQCEIRMPELEKKSICKIINDTLTKAYNEAHNMTPPKKGLLN